MEADPELTKAFQELQMKKSATAQQMELIDSKINTMHRGTRINELTLAYVSQQPEAAPMYRTIGRAYFMIPKQGMEELLQSKIQRLADGIKSMEDNKTVLQANLKESENAIRELVMKKRQKMSLTSTN